MPQVSRVRVSGEVWEKMWKGLVRVIVENNREDRADALVSGLLTQTERVMIAKRLMVGVLTLSNWPVVAIASELKMGTATVYKYQALLEKDISYRKILEKSFPKKVVFDRDEKKRNNIFIDFLETIYSLRHNRHGMVYGTKPKKRL